MCCIAGAWVHGNVFGLRPRLVFVGNKVVDNEHRVLMQAEINTKRSIKTKTMNANLITEGSDVISIDEIKKLRNQLPDNWKWSKCYELAYINSRTGHEFVKKHWALSPPDEKGIVCSLGLISHDNSSNKQDFFRDVPVQWVEKSLLIVDTLLQEIEFLKSKSRVGGN